MRSTLLTFALALPLVACTADRDRAQAQPAERTVEPAVAERGSTAGAYDFGAPVASFELPDDLREISALTRLDERTLGAVQDEQGALYVLDIETGAISAVVTFGPAGDYEGLERVGDRLFVLRADGALVEVTGWEGDRLDARTHETGLHEKCDAEGLAYDERGGRLLIACKDEPGPGVNEDHRAVYAVDLATMSLQPQPAFVLDPDAIPGDKKLRPSALAVNPVNGHLAVLSSGRRVVVELSADGAVAAVHDISAAELDQPEGLEFLPGGDLFIATEGPDRPARLVRFAAR